MSDLLTEAPPQPTPAKRLPWHLRKSFLLPVITVLLLGAVSAITLLAGAVYTYVRVQSALADLSSDLEQSGLFGAPAQDLSATPAGTGDEQAAGTGLGDVGESGWVTYDLGGDLEDVEVTWTHMSTGATMTRDAADLDLPLTFQVDGNWQEIGLQAHRTGRQTGELSCSVEGEYGYSVAQDSDSGRDAAVSCYL